MPGIGVGADGVNHPPAPITTALPDAAHQSFGVIPQNERITRGRRTHVRFDIAESALVESNFGVYRQGAQIATASKNAGTVLTPAGGWICRAVETVVSNVAERGDANQSVMRIGAFAAATGMGETARFRSPTDLPNATDGASSHLATKGDYFLQMRHSGTFKSTTHDADVAAFPQIWASSDNIEHDRVLVGNEDHDANQGYQVKFHVPGKLSDTPDHVWRFYYGGPTYGYGAGHQCIAFRGDGIAEMHSRMPNGDGTFQWYPYRLFRFAPLGAVAGRVHTLVIFPHAVPVNV